MVARIRNNVLTHNGTHDLHAGELVTVAYRCTAWNQLHRRDEPVYRIFRHGTYWGDMYANNLTLKDGSLAIY